MGGLAYRFIHYVYATGLLLERFLVYVITYFGLGLVAGRVILDLDNQPFSSVNEGSVQQLQERLVKRTILHQYASIFSTALHTVVLFVLY